jgi:hypothetical protein
MKERVEKHAVCVGRVMLIASVVVTLTAQKPRVHAAAGQVLHLMLQLSGVRILIAKKGGYTQDILRFLFLLPIPQERCIT